MNKSRSVLFVTLVCAFFFASFALNGCGKSDPLLEVEKKIEKAQTPEKREAITKIRDVYKEFRRNSWSLKIADYILKADRNVQILESLAEYGIRQPGGTPLYISLAGQAAKAPLADKEFLQLAEIFRKQDSGENFMKIPGLGKEAARAKTEAELKRVRDKIAMLESTQPGSPPMTKEIVYDEQKVKPYVTWLQSNARPPVEYILDLFKTYDIVIIAERLHPETTQWDFIHELTGDPRFIENVGNIFTEYGSVLQQPEMEKFMNTQLSTEDRDKAVIHLLHDFWLSPIGWTNKNIFDYLGKLYTLNLQLDPQKRVALYFSDVPRQWEGLTKKEYKRTQAIFIAHRDEIMADRIAKKFREIQASGSPRKKALVIMNTRHGFGEVYQKGKIHQNVGVFLMKYFPGRVANVMMNYVASDNERIALGRRLIDKIKYDHPMKNRRDDTILGTSREQGWNSVERLTQDGIWDAAFWLMGNQPLGFSFKGSPFGKDEFDYIAPQYSMFKYEDVFTGMVFYQPLDRFVQENNIPGYYDSDFKRAVLERASMLGKGNHQGLRNYMEYSDKLGENTNKKSVYNVNLVFKPQRQ